MAKITMAKQSTTPSTPGTNKVHVYPQGNNLIFMREDGTTTVLNIDGTTTSSVPEGNNLYYTDARVDARIVNKNPINLIRVAKAGGQYTSIQAAVASIGDASATNPYVVLVAPGEYTEPQINVPSFVYVCGEDIEACIVKPDSANHHVFTLVANTGLSFLYISDAGPGYAGIYCENAGDYVVLHKLVVRYCDIGLIAKTTPTGVDSYVYLEYVDTSDCVTAGMHVISGGFASFVNAENYYIINVVQTPGYGILVDGPDAQFVCQSYGFEGLNGTGTAIRLANGAKLDAKGGTFRNWGTGIKAEATGTSPRLLLAGILFDGNTVLNLNILNPTATGHFTGYTAYTQTYIHPDCSFFITNKDAHTITVAKKGGDFTSLKAAVDSIADASATNPYEIHVGPGVFVEDTITCKQYVFINGAGDFVTEIKASSVNQHVFIGTANSAIKYLKMEGSTGSGYACVYHPGNATLVPFLIRNCSFGNTNICVKSYASTVPSILQMDSCRMGGVFNFTEAIVATNINNMPVQVLVQNFVFQDVISPFCTNFARAEGLGVSLTFSGSFIRSGGSSGTAISLSDGADAKILGLSIRGFACGIRTLNVGVAPSISAQGVLITDCTQHVSVEHPGTTGSFNGSVDSTKVTIDPSAPLTPFYNDTAAGGVSITGKLNLGTTHSSLTDVSSLIIDGGTMGVMSGGALSEGTGLNLNVASGVGYARTLDGLLKKYSWSSTSILLTASSTVYVFVNPSGILSTDGSRPSSINNIILGRVVTTATGIEFIDSTPTVGANVGNLLGQFNRFAIGALYRSGSTVSESGTRGLSVTGGEYRFSTNVYLPTGGTGITFYAYKKNGSGGYTRATATQIDNTQYDANSTLTNLTTTWYMKHSLYVVGQGSLEKYFLVRAQAQYATLTEVEQASLPSPPTYFSEGVVPIASIIVRQGSNNIIQIRDERPQINKASSGISASSTHSNLIGLNSDDHTQYLRADGARSVSGTFNLGGNPITNVGLIDGVTVSAHAARHLPNGLDPLTTAAPATSLTSATTNDVGNANSLARSNHVHAITTGTPVALTPNAANAAGTATGLAKADHVHNVATAAPVTIGLANAEGVSSSFARADHVHASNLAIKDDGTTVVSSAASLNFGTGLVVTNDGSGATTVNASAVSLVTPQEASGFINASTTSSSFVDMTGMSFTTTTTKTALIMFSGVVTNSNAARTVDVILAINGSPVNYTRRTVTVTTGAYRNSLSFQTTMAVTAGQVVSVQWLTSASTATVYERTMNIVYL